MIDSEALFVIYLTVVRLGTIVAGVMAIRYGYKLFAAGVFKVDIGGATTEMAGRVGNYELKFKTAAPGAVLGLFGAMIIIITIAAAPPELTRKKKIKQEVSGQGLKTTVETTERMRGEDAALNRLLKGAAEYREKGQTAKAIGAYQQAIRLLAIPMNELARLYMESDRFEDARVLAEVAVMMNPSDPGFAITLEEIRDSMEGK
jgi:tetratricopeptide (TPR) repeat protein